MPPAGESAPQPVADGARRGAAVFWLKLAVSATLLSYQLLRGGDGAAAAVAKVLSHAAPGWLLAALLLYLASHVVNARRWQSYAGEFGFLGGTADFARMYFAGLFINLFAPGTIAGDVSRGIALAGGRRRAAAFGSVVAHRLSGMVALFALAGLAAVVQREFALPAVARLAAAVVPLAGIAFLLATPTAVTAVGRRMGRPVALPKTWAAATARTLIVAAGYHGLQIAATICLARALAVDVQAWTLALVVPLVNAAGMVPVTISGVGVREAGYVLLLQPIGVANEKALALGLLGSALVFAAGLSGAPAFFMRNRSTPG